jgi:hypothetical protein
MDLLPAASSTPAAADRSDPPCRGIHSPPLEPIVHSDHAGPPIELFSARGFEWVTADLPIPGLPPELEGFRILHLSDLHIRPKWDPVYDDLQSKVRAHPPDLIVFTGDFIEDKHNFRREIPFLRRFFAGLVSRLGTVAIFGNHDGDLLSLPLSEMNLTRIDHRRLSLHSGSATIELIGIAGVEREDFDPDFLHALSPKPERSIRILLSHYPDLIRKSMFLDPDLFLTGHTHGGQVCLPGKIPILRHDSLPRKFIGGINRFHTTWLVVNRGIGFSSLPIRLFCPAEVIEIHLRKAGATSPDI